MRKSLITETLYEVSIVFRKESFINAKKVLNFIQSLTNERKVIKSLTAFHTTDLFRQLLPKGKYFPFGKESVFPFWKKHPHSEDTKFKLSLCMSLLFCALRNVSFNDANHILKFFNEGFENLPSRFFFNFGNLLSSIEQCTWLHLYFPFGKFYLDIRNKMADNNGTALPHKTDFDISKDRFYWIDIFIRWFEDYQLPCQFLGYY